MFAIFGLICYNKIMDEIRKILESALDRFNDSEEYLLENDLSERCICGRLAYHIQQTLLTTVYSDYIVDVEYNRSAKGKEKSPKVLHDKKIVVDLIVHKRGYSEYIGFDNLFCIEMKKSNSRYRLTEDKRRLREMTDYEYGFNYKRGYMIIADMNRKRLIIESEFRLNDY